MARQLLDFGPATATRLASELNMTATAMRKHLDSLESEGFVLSHDEAPFGPKAEGNRGRGRPAKIFALTQAGREFFEESYDEIALSAIRFIEEKFGREAIKEFAEIRLNKLLSGSEKEINSIEELSESLIRKGFSSSVQPSPFPNAKQLCQHNCPISHIASEYPEFCEAETEVFGKSLGVHVTRISTIASGSAICTTNVPNPQSRRSA